MKILGTTKVGRDDGYIIEATADEVARIAGFYSHWITDQERAAGRKPPAVGDQVMVNERWRHWQQIEENRSDLKAAAKLLETTAALLRSDVLHFMEAPKDAPITEGGAS